MNNQSNLIIFKRRQRFFILLLSIIFNTSLLILSDMAYGQKIKDVIPIRECVEYIGSGKYVVYFGYDNPNNDPVIIAEDSSLVIYSSKKPNGKGVNHFNTGRQYKVFSAEFEAKETVKWKMVQPNGEVKEVTASANSSHCSSVDSSIIPLFDCPDEGGVLWPEVCSLAAGYSPDGTTESNEVYTINNGNVLIEIVANPGVNINDLRITLQGLGFTDEIPNGEKELVLTGYFPITNLNELNLLTDEINFVFPVVPAIPNSGIVISQGDRAQQANVLRDAYNLSGEGVTIGVISDSFDNKGGASNDINNGDLPGNEEKSGNPIPVEILKDLTPRFGNGIDEGRAMLQLIQDTAPGAKKIFRTGVISSGDFAEAIRELFLAGSDVITDDLTYLLEPWFRPGVIAQAVIDVTSQGIHYFTSAGNFSRRSREYTWLELTDNVKLPFIADNKEKLFDFGGGDYTQSISMGVGICVVVTQWDQDFASLGQGSGALSDINFWITDDDGNLLYEANRDNTFEDPVEFNAFRVTRPTSANIIYSGKNVPQGLRFKTIFFLVPVVDGVDDFFFNEHSSLVQSTIIGHANVGAANTVGAAFYPNTPAYGQDPPTLSSFSSTGGTPVNGFVNEKPNFIGPSGLNTTVVDFGTDLEPDGFPNFVGTSAAAPSVAAVAALLLEGIDRYYDNSSGPIREEIDPSGMTTLLQTTARDMDVTGFDFNTGYGLIQGDAAMATLAEPSPQLIQLLWPDDVTPGEVPFTLTVEGRYLTENVQILFRGDPLEITARRDNGDNITQIDATLPPFIGNPPIQAYNPPNALTNGLDGGTTEPLYFFTPQKTTVTIKTDFTEKVYGEELPAFTYSIIMPEGSPEFPAEYIDLLPEIDFTTLANSLSEPGFYFVEPHFAIDPDTGEPEDPPIGLQELYDFEFEDGALFIDKLPITIRPLDIEITYGDVIPQIEFVYDLPADIVIPRRDFILTNIREEHNAQVIEDTIALVNRGIAYVNRGIAYVNTSFSITETALNRGIAYVNGNNIIDVDPVTLDDYLESPNNAIVNRGIAFVNTQAIVNGTAINNRGIAYVNRGIAYVNTSTVNDTSNVEVITIVDEDDEIIDNIYSMNLITSWEVVTNDDPNYIIPAAYFSDLFECTYLAGELTVLPAELAITADDKVINEGDPAPELSSTITGYVNEETFPDVFGEGAEVTYTINPEYLGDPEVYEIIPYISSDPDNYIVDFINGFLYVNPAGPGTRKVRTYLDCVENNIDPVTMVLYPFVANFRYENPNPTPVYVPLGEENYLTSEGIYQGEPPQLFVSGTGTFTILFDGNKLIWNLTTRESNLKSAVSSEASSTSSRCSTSEGARIAAEIQFEDQNPETWDDIEVYPNPVSNNLTITWVENSEQISEFMVFDSQGKVHDLKYRLNQNGGMEIDFQSMKPGLYLIKMSMDETPYLLRIIKE